MKKILYLLLTMLVGLSSYAQLAGTKWKGTMNIPTPAVVYLDFKKDTLNMILVEDGRDVETMAYSIMQDTLQLVKVEGLSPCDMSGIGLYRLKQDGGKLFIIPLKDDCEERYYAFNEEAWIKEEQ